MKDCAERCDVLVCGGGFAGISAALAAARMGRQVTLLEKQYLLGGLGTAGLVTFYLPLCDGMGRQVSFGIAEELLRLSISMGAEAEYPANWLDSTDGANRTEKDPRFRVRYNPSLFAILAEQLLLKEGVKLRYGCYAVAVTKTGHRIDTVVVESISGRQAIHADTVVDATGDACIAHLAGAPTAVNSQGNALASWYYSLGQGGCTLNTLGFSDVPSEDWAPGKKPVPLTERRFDGLDRDDVTDMMVCAHASILRDIQKRRAGDASIVPTAIASIPQVRMTRRITGEYDLSEEDVHRRFADSVGMVSDWRKRGPVYEVPFSSLYAADVPNLICAGRCTSVTEPMWDIMRVIPCCAVTGQAAGTAAAMGRDFPALDVRALQAVLEKNGVVLHEDQLPPRKNAHTSR